MDGIREASELTDELTESLQNVIPEYNKIFLEGKETMKAESN